MKVHEAWIQPLRLLVHCPWFKASHSDVLLLIRNVNGISPLPACLPFVDQALLHFGCSVPANCLRSWSAPRDAGTTTTSLSSGSLLTWLWVSGDFLQYSNPHFLTCLMRWELCFLCFVWVFALSFKETLPASLQTWPQTFSTGVLLELTPSL